MRGYLWFSLAKDVIEEFDEFTKTDNMALFAQYGVALQMHEHRERQRERKIARAHLEPVRNARHGNWWRRLAIANRVASHTSTGSCRTPSRQQVNKRMRDYKRTRKAQSGTNAGGK